MVSFPPLKVYDCVVKRIARSKVSAEADGLTLIDFLAWRFTYLTPVEWMAMASDGRLTVDGERADATRHVRAGDTVEFDIPMLEEPPVDARFSVAFEEGGLIVIDKPANLPCHPGGRFFKNTLWYLLRERLGTVRLLSRLDRETSGLILACADPATETAMRKIAAAGGIAKRYVAMVHGAFPDSLDAGGFIGPDPDSVVRKRRAFRREAPSDHSGFENCNTKFTAIARAGSFSSVRAELATGRTHQIRATLASLGFPVVGDKLYGLDETTFLRFAENRLSDRDRELLILDRQALHASELEFDTPSGGHVRIESPVPWDFPPRYDARSPTR